MVLNQTFSHTCLHGQYARVVPFLHTESTDTDDTVRKWRLNANFYGGYFTPSDAIMLYYLLTPSTSWAARRTWVTFGVAVQAGNPWGSNTGLYCDSRGNS